MAISQIKCQNRFDLNWMRSLLKRHGVNTGTVVAAALVLFELLFWAVMIFTRGGYWWGAVFTYNGHHFGNDMYLPLAAAQAYNPWETGLNYPAGAIILFKSLTLMTPTSMREPVGSPFYQTYYSSAAAMVLLYTISLLVLIAGILMLIGDKQSKPTRILLVVGLVFSSPVIFNYISQNCVLLVAGLTSIFAASYDSETKWKRYLAYAVLGLAATIKLYPAAFAWMVLFGKHKKEFIPCCLISAAFVILPFFYYDGVQSIVAFLSNLTSESASKVNWGVGYNYSLQNMIKILSILINSYYSAALPILPKLLVTIIVVSVSSLVKEDWQRWFLIATAFIWFFDYSYQYMLLFYIPSFIMVLHERKEHKSIHIVAIVLLFIILVPCVTPEIAKINDFFNNSSYLVIRGEDGGTIYPISFDCLIKNLAIIGLVAGIFLARIIEAFRSLGKHTERGIS